MRDAGSHADQNKISILYVDDEQELLRIGKKFLERSEEFRVDVMTSAQEALKSSRIQSYDAIVSDYQMPGMDGIAFLKVVREHGDVPFILFTGRGCEEVAIEAVNHGADFYLQKGRDPEFQFATLAHTIRQAVKRKQTVQELRRSEERYRTMLNDLTGMIIRFTPDGIITFINEEYRLTFVPMQNPDEIPGTNFHELMHNTDSDNIDDFLNSLNPRRPIRDMERKVTGTDGNTHWQLWTVRAIFEKPEKLVEYLLVGKDITRQKDVEIALKKSKEKLNILSEITRHDILNELTILHNVWYLLNETETQDPEIVHYYEEIRKCYNSIYKSIVFTRDYQMLGDNPPVWQNIEKILQISALDNLPDQITLSIHTDHYELFADPMLMLVFYNLFDNAKRYGDTISEISICFKEKQKNGLLIIEDNGVGVPSDMKDNIFRKGVGKNTGLGLFLAKEILSITGLSIIENGVEGQGARFEITIPPGKWKIGDT